MLTPLELANKATEVVEALEDMHAMEPLNGVEKSTVLALAAEVYSKATEAHARMAVFSNALAGTGGG